MKREGMDGRMGKGNTAGGCDIAGIVLFLLAGTAFGQFYGARAWRWGNRPDEQGYDDGGYV